MKLLYGLILILMVFVSACVPQSETVLPSAPEPQAAPPQVPEPEAAPGPEQEVDTDGTGAAVAPLEVSSSEIRVVGAGAFDPAKLTISAGSSVTWINDAGKNTVVIIFKDGKAYTNSLKFEDGEKFEHEFSEPGEYQYWQNVAFSSDGGKITVE